MRLAGWGAPSYKYAVVLSTWSPNGYFARSCELCHPRLEIGQHVFAGDRVRVFGWHDSGTVRLGDRVRLLSDIVIETGSGGEVLIGDDTYVHPQCQISAYQEQIAIGNRVMLAANCAMFAHNHGTALRQTMREQALQTKGPTVIGDDAWLGAGVTVLAGARIGRGAAIGAGSVVTKDIPDYAVAFGVPARIVRFRRHEDCAVGLVPESRTD